LLAVCYASLHGCLFRIPLESGFSSFDHMQQVARISPLVHDGTVIGTFTVIEDVTERVARENQLQTQLDNRSKLLASEKSAREEAEQANRLKDEFLATISHELRTPLSAILGWAHLLRSQEISPSMTSRAIDAIYRNAHSQTQLISDLLDISRIPSPSCVRFLTSAAAS
jgi:signal transduction histidine kinase